MHALQELVDPKIKRILQLLLDHKSRHFHLQQISIEAHVSLSTTFRIIKKLVKLQFIDTTTIGKFKIYRIADNEKTKGLQFRRSK